MSEGISYSNILIIAAYVIKMLLSKYLTHANRFFPSGLAYFHKQLCKHA